MLWQARRKWIGSAQEYHSGSQPTWFCTCIHDAICSLHLLKQLLQDGTIQEGQLLACTSREDLREASRYHVHGHAWKQQADVLRQLQSRPRVSGNLNHVMSPAASLSRSCPDCRCVCRLLLLPSNTVLPRQCTVTSLVRARAHRRYTVTEGTRHYHANPQHSQIWQCQTDDSRESRASSRIITGLCLLKGDSQEPVPVGQSACRSCLQKAGTCCGCGQTRAK